MFKQQPNSIIPLQIGNVLKEIHKSEVEDEDLLAAAAEIDQSALLSSVQVAHVY